MAGLYVVSVSLFVLYDTFGAWAIFLGLILLPITYVASIFIVWFETGDFPLLLLIPYVVSFVGLLMAGAGGAISED